MHIRIICPAPPRSTTGNRITALRWAGLLGELGHRVTIEQTYTGGPCEVLVAMHARRSADAVFRSRELAPARPVILAFTGTDLYRDIHVDPAARRAIELADRYVLLQPAGLRELPKSRRLRARVILQSAVPPRRRSRRSAGLTFAIVGHLREEKDPFRALEALRWLPSESKIHLIQVGGALDPSLEERALRERSSRYRWTGEVSPARARRIIADADALVLTSIMEGGANVISEAVVAGTPVLASRIPSSVALLGSRYPGFFPVGDTASLAALMKRFEADAQFRQRLKTWVSKIAPKFHPSRERRALDQLLRGLGRRVKRPIPRGR